MDNMRTSSWTRRRGLVFLCFLFMGVTLVVRSVYIQVFYQEFSVEKTRSRHVRSVAIPAHRGDLLDRSGDPLAISVPIQSLHGVPAKLAERPEDMRKVAALLNINASKLIQKITSSAKEGDKFMYIKRHVLPEIVDQVKQLQLRDVEFESEYRRYYPTGSASAHIGGFTDIDDIGQEGMELAYNQWLTGKPGKRRVITDRKSREITGLDIIEPAIPGNDLRLSVDRKLQYFASRELRKAIAKHDAESGSVVVMDVKTGEVLAMVNYPIYNPNDTSDRGGSGGRQRNRAMTDVFEPGSTMKPFTIAAALDSGKFKPEDIVFTSPGYYRLGKYKISDDDHDHGWLDLRGVIVKSSNVGISKIARQLDPEQMWTVFDAFGFGRPPGSEFPGEVAGFFNHSTQWNHTEQATVSYGYGISVSAMQLVRAYATLANDGVMQPVSFVALDSAGPGRRVIKASIAREVQSMLESAVAVGTGTRAQVPGYRVAGKTGTLHKSQSGGYSEDSYVSVFAGFAPASNPRLAMVVVIHDPKAGQYFGGTVAAPVFSKIMSHGLRLEGVEPDDINNQRAQAPGLQFVPHGGRL